MLQSKARHRQQYPHLGCRVPGPNIFRSQFVLCLAQHAQSQGPRVGPNDAIEAELRPMAGLIAGEHPAASSGPVGRNLNCRPGGLAPPVKPRVKETGPPAGGRAGLWGSPRPQSNCAELRAMLLAAYPSTYTENSGSVGLRAAAAAATPPPAPPGLAAASDVRFTTCYARRWVKGRRMNLKMVRFGCR